MAVDRDRPGKERFCFNCGDAMGWIADCYYDRLDSCGKRECLRAAQDTAQKERDAAHEKLDRDMGW